MRGGWVRTGARRGASCVVMSMLLCIKLLRNVALLSAVTCGSSSAALSLVVPSSDRYRSVEVVLPALADVVHGGPDVLLTMDRTLLGDVAEHLDPEAAVEVVDDPLLPRSADDLRGGP